MDARRTDVNGRIHSFTGSLLINYPLPCLKVAKLLLAEMRRDSYLDPVLKKCTLGRGDATAGQAVILEHMVEGETDEGNDPA